jgi:hypothetical protein
MEGYLDIYNVHCRKIKNKIHLYEIQKQVEKLEAQWAEPVSFTFHSAFEETQLYCGGQFYWLGKLEKTTDLSQVTDKL